MSDTAPPDQPDQPRPLEFFTIDQMFEEIERRTETAVLAYTQTTKLEAEERDILVHYSGYITGALGTIDLARMHLSHTAMKLFEGDR